MNIKLEPLHLVKCHKFTVPNLNPYSANYIFTRRNDKVVHMPKYNDQHRVVDFV